MHGTTRHVPELIKRFSRSKPAIISCHTKKEIVTLSMELSKVRGIGIINGGNNAQLASQTKLTTLQRSLLRRMMASSSEFIVQRAIR